MSVTISYPSTQFEELHGSFVNLGVHLPPKHNSPKIKFPIKLIMSVENLNFELPFMFVMVISGIISVMSK